MNRFPTLMRREWIQHRRGWLVTLLAPPLLVLLLLLGPSRIDVSESVSPLIVAPAAVAITTLGAFAIFSVVTWLQLPGLARRDRQDRSIEFWLSLPVGHAAAVGAPLLMHLLVMPMAALALGALFGQAFGFLVIAKLAGVGAWLGLPWGLLLRDELLAWLSFVFGAVVATFWLLPFALLAMAASAWLGRRGAAALVVLLSVLHGLLSQFYGIGVIGETARALVGQAAFALLPHDFRQWPMSAAATAEWLQEAPARLLGATADVASHLLQPLALTALVLSAAGFGLLVLRRRRSG